MCGIIGYSVAPNSLNSIDFLEKSIALIRHRGPDDSGIFLDSKMGIGLAHARLSILDVSPLGHQPMVSKDGRMVLIYNGEIYNYTEIRDELITLGHEFIGNSDTEVILQLFAEYRKQNKEWNEILLKLNGIFAFAVWDNQLNELIIARDAFGVKPFYYIETEERFIFSSEIKGLLPLCSELKDIDPVSFHRYLTYLWCPGNGTPFRDVKKLGPGESIIVKNGKILKKNIWYHLPYYKNDSQKKFDEYGSICEKSLIQETGTHLRQAVHRQMVSDVPVGAFLSGGLDSSSIVAFARELKSDIKCYTIQATNWELDEVTDDVPFAVEAAKYLNVPLEIVPINSEKMANDFANMVVQLDEPLADPACLNVLYISQLAREAGVKVLLSGAGGDDIFTGYRRHRAIMLEKWWSWLPHIARSGLQGLSGKLNTNSVISRRLNKLFRSANLDSESRLMDYFVWAKRDDLVRIYTPEFRSSIKNVEADFPFRSFLDQFPDSLQPLEKMMLLEQRFFLTDHNLIYTDKMSMAAGVEVRVPFLDLDLVEFASKIPLKYKQNGACGKWILKKAMEPYLPKSIIYRKKSGFGAPLRRWIRFELKEMIGDILSEQSLKNRGIFNTTEVHRIISKNLNGSIDASYTILSLLLIELWCRNFIDDQVKLKIQGV